MGDRITSTTRAKRTWTPDQWARRLEYMREYRKAHPEAMRRYRDAYILRRAARLQAEAEAVDGGNGGGH